jgi:hypothetical protein
LGLVDVITPGYHVLQRRKSRENAAAAGLSGRSDRPEGQYAARIYRSIGWKTAAIRVRIATATPPGAASATAKAALSPSCPDAIVAQDILSQASGSASY